MFNTPMELRLYLVSRYSEEFLLQVGGYLNALRTSGVTNMYGAAPYVFTEFYDFLIEENDAKLLLQFWMLDF